MPSPASDGNGSRRAWLAGAWLPPMCFGATVGEGRSASTDGDRWQGVERVMERVMTIPSEQDLVRLPYFAILALGARYARQVEPLFRTWKSAPSTYVIALSKAIDGVEELARCPDPDARALFWVPAADATQFAAEVASAADRARAPAAALRAADAAAELLDAIDPACVRSTAARAVSRSIRASLMAIELEGSRDKRAFLGQLELDLERLRLRASLEGWTDETGVGLQSL